MVTALIKEAQGYGKPNMTEQERIDEHKMLQRFLSLGIMMKDDDNDDEPEDLEANHPKQSMEEDKA